MKFMQKTDFLFYICLLKYDNFVQVRTLLIVFFEDSDYREVIERTRLLSVFSIQCTGLQFKVLI